MKRLAFSAAALAAIAFAPAAFAQSATPPAEIDPAQLVKLGDALIAAGQTGDVFENISEKTMISIRHRRTGFVCDFSPEDANNAVDVLPGAARGEDIACQSKIMGAVMSMYLTKFPTGVTLDQAFNGYVREVLIVHPDTKEATGAFGDMSTQAEPLRPPLPEHKSARFTFQVNGRPAFSRLSVAVVGDWVIEQRITNSAADPLALDLLGEFVMISAITDVRDGPPAPPAAPKP